MRILESNTRFGSGDEPDVRHDRPGPCYYLAWQIAGAPRFGAISGPFDTVSDAERGAFEQSHGTVTWST